MSHTDDSDSDLNWLLSLTGFFNYMDGWPDEIKIKTKSSIKKRFSRTGSGKIKFKPAGKKHGMSKRSNKFIRNTRRSSIMSPGDAALIDHMLPYNK